MSLAEVWEGKQNKFEQIGYVVLVVFEVQFLYANLVQIWEQHSRTALQQFWSVVAAWCRTVS